MVRVKNHVYTNVRVYQCTCIPMYTCVCSSTYQNERFHVLDVELFADVVAEKCQHQIKASCVLVALYKPGSTPGRWKRLYKGPYKVRFYRLGNTVLVKKKAQECFRFVIVHEFLYPVL